MGNKLKVNKCLNMVFGNYMPIKPFQFRIDYPHNQILVYVSMSKNTVSELLECTQ